MARLARWNDDHPLRADGGLASLLLVLVLAIELTAATEIGWGVAFSAALVACVPFRRRAPVATFAAVCALCAAQLLVMDRPVSADVVALIVLYTVVAYGPGSRNGKVATAGVSTGAVVAAVRWEHVAHGVSPANAVLTTVAVVLMAATLGAWRRSRQAQLAALRVRNRLLTAERDQQAAVSSAMERARIAREFHDVVAHSLAVVVVQADGAAAVAVRQPETAVAALRTIADTGREALGQMRRLVGVLRDGQEGGSPPRVPQPGVAQLEPLVAQVVNAGLPARLTVQGRARPLPAKINATLYRLAQEALTNILKHAGTVSQVDVALTYSDRAVKVSIHDDGQGGVATGDAEGHGLVGMRERVQLHDGTLMTGPGRDGGFSVEACIPTGESVGAAA